MGEPRFDITKFNSDMKRTHLLVAIGDEIMARYVGILLVESATDEQVNKVCLQLQNLGDAIDLISNWVAPGSDKKQ